MPNTREKLIELVDDFTEPLSVRDIHKTDFAEEFADHLIANGVTVQKWISVKDRLPDKHGTVYVCLLKFPESEQAFPYCLNWYEYGDNGYVNGRHFQDEGVCGLKVTHWMPLPEAPKGE